MSSKSGRTATGYHIKSQKVIHNGSRAIFVLLLRRLLPVRIILRRSVENVEESLSGVAHFQYASQIAATVTVIRGTPHRAEPVVVQNLIPLLA